MKQIHLYEKTVSFNGVYPVLLVNRMQVLYFLLFMPAVLVHPYMVWVILIAGLCSQGCLWMISKWLKTAAAQQGYQGFSSLFGRRVLQLLCLIGIFFLFLKISILVLGYSQIVRQFVYPSMDSDWMILIIVLIVWYLSSHGIIKTIRFSVIAFLISHWMSYLFMIFFFSTGASIQDLYPLVPTEWNNDLWQGLLFVFSAFSGPEYLIFLGPWMRPDRRLLRNLSIGNLLSVTEYVILFIASILFFGTGYLSRTEFPLIEMMKYLQTPLFEHIDTILISIYMFNFVFVASILMLLLFGSVRMVLNRPPSETSTPFSFLGCIILLLFFILLVNETIWQNELGQDVLVNYQIWAGAASYLLVPAILLLIVKWKGRV